MSMKLTVRYEGTEDNNLVLKFTLSEKHASSTTGHKLIDLFSKSYNKKFDPEVFDFSVHDLRPVGGNIVTNMDQLISDYCQSEAELYILPKGCEPRVAAAPVSPLANTSSSSSTKPKSNGVSADGKIRCKNFGCNVMYDPSVNYDERGCRHHKAAPIFHETAKWWSCCPNTKAYDWDEFQSIKGCQYGVHSAVAAKKQVLGGVDLREANAPKRIDGGVELLDSRKKLERLRAAFLTIGVHEDDFDKTWGRLSAKHGDLDEVAKVMKIACDKALQIACSGEICLDAATGADVGGGDLEDMD